MSKDKLNIKVQTQYTLVQGMYWIFAASASGFLTPILQGKGFLDMQIGILNAIKCISMIVFQVILSSVCDKYAKKIPLKYIVVLLVSIGFVSTAVFCYLPVNFYEAILLFVALGASLNCIPAFIDALSIQYINHGINVSYTMARGIGSLTWAISCLFIGEFSVRYGAYNILKLQLIFLVLFAFFVLCLQKVDFSKEVTNLKTENVNAKKENETVHNALYLLKNYPKYTIFIVGSVLATMSYTMGNIFLINVVDRVGGNDFHFGICQFVLAIVEVPTAIFFVRLKNKLNLERLMVIFAVFNTFQTAGTIYAANVYQVIFCQAFEMLGFGLFYAAKVYFVIENLPNADVVKGGALISVFTNGFGAAASMLLCGFIKETFGLTVLLWSGTITGILSVVVMLILNFIHAESRLDGM